MIVVCGLAFVALGLSMVRSDHASPSYSLGEIRLIGWVCLVIFALCTASGIAQLIRPGNLRIGPDGLDMSILAATSMRTIHYDWSDIDYFDLISVGRGGKVVGWYFAPGYTSRSTIGSMLLDTAVRRGALSGIWPMSNKKLLAMLKEAQARWARSPADGTGGPEIPVPLLE